MLRSTMLLMTFALAIANPIAASSGGIDDLEGGYAFDWFKDPASTKCVEVGSELLAAFKSAEFTCDLSDHPTSGESPAKMCSKAGGGSEYLIFDTLAHCEDERETQSVAE
jgi:hypothetical protein